MTQIIELIGSAAGKSENITVELEQGGRVREVVEIIKGKVPGLPQGELLLFIENGDEPLALDLSLGDCGIQHHHRVHAHPCRRIEVTVGYGGAAKQGSFSPATTMAHVKHWSEKEFGLSGAAFFLELEDTGGHLADSGHLGTLTHGCKVALELVPETLNIDYTVDDEKQVSHQRYLTARQILKDAGYDPAQYYLKQIKHGQQGVSYQGEPDKLIRLHEHEKFSAIFMGGTTVS